MKITIVGTGAVGGYYGLKLMHKGHDVNFIATTRSCKIIKEKGMHIKSVDGDIHFDKVMVSDDMSFVKDTDVILLCTKSYSTKEIAYKIKEKVNNNAVVISLQNGIENEEILSDILGKERIIGSTVFIFSSSPAAGEIIHSGAGSIILGELDGTITERIEKYANMFSESGIPAKISENIKKDLWKKLFINASYNGFTAILGDSLKNIKKVPEANQAYYDILKECQMVAKAEGIDITDEETKKIFERFNQDNFLNVKSSTLQDIEKGKPVEIDAIQGAVVRKALKHNLKAPLNNLMYALIKLKTINFEQ